MIRTFSCRKIKAIFCTTQLCRPTRRDHRYGSYNLSPRNIPNTSSDYQYFQLPEGQEQFERAKAN